MRLNGMQGVVMGQATQEDDTEDPSPGWAKRPSDSTNESIPNPAWIGPMHVGCCVVEILGPMQLLCVVLAFVAAIFLIAEYIREDGGPDVARTIAGLLFIFVCIYLVHLVKSIYLLKALRREVSRFRNLNRRLKGEVEDVALQNREYTAKNEDHRQLNEQLSGKIGDLEHVQQQLFVLSMECDGNVIKATQLVERLERNTKLNTSNSIHLFFGHADRNKNGRIDVEEVDTFVDSLCFFKGHFPAFEPDNIRQALIEQGGMSMDQIRNLVDSMMPDAASPSNSAVDGCSLSTEMIS